MKRIVRTNRPEPTAREVHLENALECMRIAKEGIKVQLAEAKIDVVHERRKAAKVLAALNAAQDELTQMRHQTIVLVVDKAEYATPEHAETRRKLVIRDRHSGRIVEGVINASVDQAYKDRGSEPIRAIDMNIDAKVNTYYALQLTLRYPGTPLRPETLAGMHPWEE